MALPLAPGCRPELAGDDGRAFVDLPGSAGRAEFELPDGLTWHIEEAPYYPRFGVEQSREVLVGEGRSFGAGALRITFRAGPGGGPERE